MSQVVQSLLQRKVQFSEEVMQVAHFVLSQDKQLPESKYLPSSQLKQVASTAQVLQKSLHGI